jgi:hypothetical protein
MVVFIRLAISCAMACCQCGGRRADIGWPKRFHRALAVYSREPHTFALFANAWGHPAPKCTRGGWGTRRLQGEFLLLPVCLPGSVVSADISAELAVQTCGVQLTLVKCDDVPGAPPNLLLVGWDNSMTPPRPARNAPSPTHCKSRERGTSDARTSAVAGVTAERRFCAWWCG